MAGTRDNGVRQKRWRGKTWPYQGVGNMSDHTCPLKVNWTSQCSCKASILSNFSHEKQANTKRKQQYSMPSHSSRQLESNTMRKLRLCICAFVHLWFCFTQETVNVCKAFYVERKWQVMLHSISCNPLFYFCYILGECCYRAFSVDQFPNSFTCFILYSFFGPIGKSQLRCGSKKPYKHQLGCKWFSRKSSVFHLLSVR